MLPILFPAGQSLTHLFTYYAKIILQVQLQQRQIHHRQVLEHLFANRSDVDCSKRQQHERPSENERLQNYELKVRKTLCMTIDI